MTIDDVLTCILRLPEVRAVGDGSQDVLVVLVRTDSGAVGIGEMHTAPTVGAAIIHAPISHVRSRGLASVLVGEDPLDIDGCWQLMADASEVYGRRGVAMHAISGVDLALWDLRGKLEGRSVSDMLGGRHREVLRPYASVLMPETVEEAEILAADCRDEGFTAVKYGWGGLGAGPDRARALVSAVRSTDPRAELMIDVGAGLPFEAAIRLAELLAPFRITFLEEPLHPDDLDGFARLREASPIPIATGEKETSLAGFRELITRGRPHIVQPDLARAGGFTEVERIYELARTHGIEVIPHCWSTDILVAATCHFIASRPMQVPLEFCLADNAIRRNLATQPLRFRGDGVHVPAGPGLGIALDPDTIDHFAVQSSHPLGEILEAIAM